MTLIDSLSTLAILAGGPEDKDRTGHQALSDFQDGIADFVLYYGDGRKGPTGEGIRARGFDLDSKVQVFETVIRGVGGLLSAHLFAIGELPIRGYNPKPKPGFHSDDPMELSPIQWPNGFRYDGQLLRLAYDLTERLLPAFYTSTGIPYPRVNLRHGIPFYTNSPLHQRGADEDSGSTEGGRAEITETCSAGAGSLTLEFTVLSRLTGDARFEQAAKRAFWEVWGRRSDIGLIGNGIDAERGVWIGPHSGIGAGMDSFFEYALKSHVLLSGHGMPNSTASRRSVDTNWLDPNSLHSPLPPELHSSDAFLQAWHQAHASVKRYLYTDRSHYPYYTNGHRATGQPYTMWIDSLGAFYPGLLALAGEVEEAIEANLVYTALWTRYAAIPERWSVRENSVEGGLGWWPGRPEFVESTYYIYRATKDPWYLRVGEMVQQDIKRRCYAKCGWAGLQDVRTGEKQDRMESFFLGETTKYMYLLFDPDHPLNKIDAAYVFTTEGHPLIIPKKSYSSSTGTKRATKGTEKSKVSSADDAAVSLYQYYDETFTNSCPIPQVPLDLLAGSATAARPGLFDVSRFTNLYTTPNIHGPLEAFQVQDEEKGGSITRYRASSNHSLFPWTLPPSMLPFNGTCTAPPSRVKSWIEFPTNDPAASLMTRLGTAMMYYDHAGPVVHSIDGLKLELERQDSDEQGNYVWKITSVGNTQIARHETVFFHAEHVRHYKDDAFICIRRSDNVEIALLVDHPATKDNGSTTEAMPHEETAGLDLDLDLDDHVDDFYTEPEDTDTLLKSILRAVSSVFDPLSTTSSSSATSSSTKSMAANDQKDSLIYTWQANTPTGAGAFPVPSIPDTLITGSPGYNSKTPLSHFPWTTIFMAGQACEGPLPNISSRDHQIIVMRRGGCSFSQKLDNIPSFAPSASALQLVLIIDERDEHVLNPMEPVTPRPMLSSEQVTPNGVRRPHGVPMVLLNAAVGDYDLFDNAAAVGMRRKYKVKSQGLIIENASVL